MGSVGARFFRGDRRTEVVVLVAMRGLGASRASNSGNSSSDAYVDIVNDGVRLVTVNTPKPDAEIVACKK